MVLTVHVAAAKSAAIGTVLFLALWATVAFGSDARPISHEDISCPRGERSAITLGVSPEFLTVADGRVVGFGPTSFEERLPGTSEDSPEYTIRRNINEVHLRFIVVNPDGHTERHLSASELSVTEDRAVVEHFRLSCHDDVPLKLGILIDVSDSMRGKVPEEQKSGQMLLRRLLRPLTDTAFVISFGSGIQVWQRATSDLAQLATAMAREAPAQETTDLFDAIYFACVRYMIEVPEDTVQRQALFVVTDGIDQGSFHGLDDVIAIARRREISIYTLALHGTGFHGGDATLSRLANETGGRFLVAQSSNQLAALFDQMEQDIRTEYELSFVTASESKGFHPLRLTLSNTTDKKIYGQQGYVMSDR
ncbi:MAG: VWA domain-containing protein [Candidatus Korobacteraceae bacterium]